MKTFEGSIRGRQFAPILGIVNCGWDVISRQDNVKVCYLNHSVSPKHPGTARPLHLGIHLKDTSSSGGREHAPELAIVTLQIGCHIRARQCQGMSVEPL